MLITKSYQTSPINYCFFSVGKYKRIAHHQFHQLCQNNQHNLLFPVK